MMHDIVSQTDYEYCEYQEKCRGIIISCAVILLALGIFGVLPGLGIAILVGAKFASYFSKALKFGLSISFIAPFAITFLAGTIFMLTFFVKSKLLAQLPTDAPTGIHRFSNETIQAMMNQKVETKSNSTQQFSPMR
jgi:membrane-bound ClpP family serine protease